jgi:hypothetical protein
MDDFDTIGSLDKEQLAQSFDNAGMAAAASIVRTQLRESNFKSMPQLFILIAECEEGAERCPAVFDDLDKAKASHPTCMWGQHSQHPDVWVGATPGGIMLYLYPAGLNDPQMVDEYE